MILEVIVQNDKEAVRAEQLGADRLELVSDISEGGLTPSYQTIRKVLQKVTIPVQIMIRPHSHHFVYDDNDLAIILEDIQRVLELGSNRIVFGALTDKNTIDERVLSRVIELSPNLDITFHRAFDEVASQVDAYQTLVKYSDNVKRILTSGGKSSCEEGKTIVRDMVKLSRQMNGPKIMPGSGLSSENIQALHETIGASQYHFGKAVRINHSFSHDFNEIAFSAIKKIIGTV